MLKIELQNLVEELQEKIERLENDLDYANEEVSDLEDEIRDLYEENQNKINLNDLLYYLDRDGLLTAPIKSAIDEYVRYRRI